MREPYQILLSLLLKILTNLKIFGRFGLMIVKFLKRTLWTAK